MSDLLREKTRSMREEILILRTVVFCRDMNEEKFIEFFRSKGFSDEEIINICMKMLEVLGNH